MKRLQTTPPTPLRVALFHSAVHKFWCPITTNFFFSFSNFFPSFAPPPLASSLCSWNWPHHAVLGFAWCEPFPFSCRRHHDHPSLVQHLRGAMWNHTMCYSSFPLREPTVTVGHNTMCYSGLPGAPDLDYWLIVFFTMNCLVYPNLEKKRKKLITEPNLTS